MFDLCVEHEFCAAHAIRIAGALEPVHGHNFRVTLTVSAPRLDPDGLVVDFHALQHILSAVLAPWVNNNLNAVKPFTDLNPTAEHIALTIAREVDARLAALSPAHSSTPRPRVTACRVTEAPGCSVTYRPPIDPPASTRT